MGDFDTLDVSPTIDGDAGGDKLLAGRYKISHKLGEGGMGMVYLAEDTELGNNKVAIKFIPPQLAGNARAIKNLKKEAQTAMQLSHPNIVRLHDLHTDGHQKFLVMEYIEGKTLEDALAEKDEDKFTLEEVLPIAEQIAAGLDYAHSRKVLHRDLKPSNIMIAKDNTVKLLDFGIAREMKDSYTRVTGNETSGTLPYMSPEQLMGENPTVAMDIYSFAAVIYECLSSHPPFYMGDIREQIRLRNIDPISNIPQAINDSLLVALSKERNQRPVLATGLISGLKKYMTAAADIKGHQTSQSSDQVIQTQKQKNERFVCEVCGKKIQPDSKVCPNCGSMTLYYAAELIKDKLKDQGDSSILSDKNYSAEQVGKINEDRSCLSCKKVVQVDWKMCPFCRASLTAEICSNCGKEMQTDWKKCPYCLSNRKEPESLGRGGQNKNEELENCIQEAAQGDDIAQYMLALMYEKGEGVPKDKKEAAKWYHKAAEQGNAIAQCNLALMYKKGEGVQQDKKEAIELFRKAASHGSAEARYNLGVCYQYGEGLSRDYKAAVNWYKKAAKGGHAPAQINLGKMYDNGEGVSQDKSEAVKWYRKAAEQGHYFKD